MLQAANFSTPVFGRVCIGCSAALDTTAICLGRVYCGVCVDHRAEATLMESVVDKILVDNHRYGLPPGENRRASVMNAIITPAFMTEFRAAVLRASARYKMDKHAAREAQMADEAQNTA